MIRILAFLRWLPRAITNRPLPDDLSSCDWYRGLGPCSQPGRGCTHAMEPRCQVEEPSDGWPSKRNLPGRLRWIWEEL